MTNKKFSNFINTLSYYKSLIPKKYISYYDDITSLYTKRIIESKASVEKMLNTLANNKNYKKTPKKIQDVLNFVDSTKHRKPENKQEGIKFVPLVHHEPVAGIKEKNQERDFFLTADIKRYVSWKKAKKVNGKIRFVWTKWYDESDIRTKKGDGQIKEEQLIKAKNLKEAKKIFYEKLLDDKEADDSEARYRVHTLNFQYVDTKFLKKEETKNMRLKQGHDHYNYQLVDEEKKHLLSGVDGFCVIDNLVGVYGPLIKGLDSKEKIIKICTEYYLNYDNVIFNPKDGISASCIDHICHLFQISHYAYDVNDQCFIKHVVKHRNYPALCYYAIDNHMYLVKSKKVKSLVEKAKEKTKTINTSALEELKQVNIFTTMNIHENINVEDYHKYESCIFIYSRRTQEINDILKNIIEHYKIIPTSIRSNKTKVTYFEVEINDVNYICVLDPNHGADMSYKRIQELCKKHDIEFKNQTFTKFVKELRFKREEIKNERQTFDAEQRKELLNKVNYKCQECSKPIDLGEFEIDHIRPLSNGGGNDESNLQALCKKCHADKTKIEQEDGSYVRIIDTESSYNTNLELIMNNELSKSYAFIEPFKKDEDPTKTKFTIDNNKCRKNIVYYSKYDYAVFTVMDDVEAYTGQTEAGIYYVETDNYLPLRGNGWYYYPMVDYCLTNNIIKEENIKYTVQASVPIPANYFNEFIDYCYDNLDDDIKKLSVNSFIGALKPNANKNRSYKTICIQRNRFNAYELYVKNEGCFIESFEINNERFYHVYKNIESERIESEAPIYNQIIQMENIEMHKLKILIESEGGNVLDINTDSITCEFTKFPWSINDDSNINNFQFEDKKYTPVYKIEHKEERLGISRMANFKRTDTFKPDKLKWNVINDNHIEKDFKFLAEQIINSNKSYNIDGRAGVGKSHLIREIKNVLTLQDKSFVCLAPTNKACRVIDGQTLHKFVSKIKHKKAMGNLHVDYVIVDEISMVKEVFYKFLLALKKIKVQSKFLLCGDFEQLLPVNDRVVCNYKNSPALLELCDGNRLELLKCRRSDDTLFNLCKNASRVNKSEFNNKMASKHLVFTNEKRIEINKLMMEKNGKKNKEKAITLSKLGYDDNSQDVTLFPRVPIIAKISDKSLNISNNQMFTVHNVTNESIYIQDKDDKKNLIEISIYDFQRMFYVAYAITIHKCQGETYDKPYTIHEWERLNKRLKYVALSRATKKDIINII
jgi:Zn finger protein HypA/HybF involved in hydrogenase expression